MVEHAFITPAEFNSSLIVKNGTVDEIDGKQYIHYDGYWVRFYEPPEESFANKRDLILALTRRTFHHTEDGINTPGDRLEAARQNYEQQADEDCKRVNAAMLAGALFNRATDLFTAIVDMEHKGVQISRDNELMKQCSQCFHEALELGQHVKHYSGEEGVDELWGEPLKAFTMPIKDFYRSRYIKIAQTMRDIDKVHEKMLATFAGIDTFDPIQALLITFCTTAKRESETMKSDPNIFQIWPDFVASGERLYEFEPKIPDHIPTVHKEHLRSGQRLVQGGRDLINYLAGVRVPMPKSTLHYFDSLVTYEERSHKLGIKHSFNQVASAKKYG